MKFQIPNPKLQINSKLQTPRVCGANDGSELKLGAWIFFGIWNLGFGASTQTPQLKEAA